MSRLLVWALVVTAWVTGYLAGQAGPQQPTKSYWEVPTEEGCEWNGYLEICPMRYVTVSWEAQGDE